MRTRPSDRRLYDSEQQLQEARSAARHSQQQAVDWQARYEVCPCNRAIGHLRLATKDGDAVSVLHIPRLCASPCVKLN